MTALVFALTLLSALAQANSKPQPGEVYCISGVVVDAVTNAPVPGARVSISRDNELTAMVAGNEGSFVFKGFEAGKYALSATATGYLEEAYNQHGGFSVAIVTGKGQDTEHLVFRLHRQAVIYGRVTDERGEAVRFAQVSLFDSDRMRGSHARTLRTQTQTNDLGEYRLAHLPPGRYYLAVQAQPWYAQSRLSTQTVQARSPGNDGSSVSVAGPGAGSDPVRDVVYPITFYPGVTDEDSSAALVLSAGASEEANITVAAVPAKHLRLRGVNSEPWSSVGVGASQPVFGTFNFRLHQVVGQVAPGEFEVAGLPPGKLTVVVTTTNKANEQTFRSVEVDSRSQGTIDAAELPAPARISGRVLFPGANAAKGGNVSLASISTPTLPGVGAPLGEDGTFNFSETPPGTYRIEVNVPSGRYYVQKVVAKEAKTSGREITISGGRDVDLTVTLGQGQGQVSGVVQLDGKPAAGIVVLLVPESGREIEEDSRVDESDSDGTFNLGGILPGDYVVVAIKDGWDLEWSEPDVLRPYLSAGQKISIAANQSVKVTVSAQERTAAIEPKLR